MKAIFRLRMESGCNHQSREGFANPPPSCGSEDSCLSLLAQQLNPALNLHHLLQSFCLLFLFSVLLCSSVSLFTCFHSTILGFGAELECRRRAAGCVPVRLCTCKVNFSHVTWRTSPDFKTFDFSQANMLACTRVTSSAGLAVVFSII